MNRQSWCIHGIENIPLSVDVNGLVRDEYFAKQEEQHHPGNIMTQSAQERSC
jgi:hypothetical protein